jgi:hypothetical protein
MAIGIGLSQLQAGQCEDQLTPNPSDGTTVVINESLGNTYPYGGRLSITSDIPVNIQRYADVDAQFVDGSHPVTAGDVRVVVTSDCDVSETTDLPTVELDNETGTINVKWNATTDMPYLNPTWYDAIWSYTSYWAGEFMYTSTIANIEVTLDDVENATLTGSTAKADATTDVAEVTTQADSTSDAPDNTQSVEESKDDKSPGHSLRKSFFGQTIATFLVLYATNVFLSGLAGNLNIFGFGKIAVAAIGVSALFSKAHPRKNSVQDITRKLQMCNFNVDILIDGCYNSFTINAPSARIVDANMVNLTSSEDANDPATTNYMATLEFPLYVSTTELQPNSTVASIECVILAEGRPFIDTTGKSLQASPVLEADLSWLGYLEEKDTDEIFNLSNSTELVALSLGEDWTRRALAEHASVASFSAFSIALMTNQAPSILVEDSLKAAQDEIRHTKVSFDIASILTGKEVGPGPLPASKLEFEQDLTSLALSVAREGCVDETLSTFSAALEANAIDDVLNSVTGNTKYSNIDHNVLALMRDELKQISVEESSHSALAWRTLSWICSVDTKACTHVHEEVFKETVLRQKINQVLPNQKLEVLEMVHEQWMQVLASHRMNHKYEESHQQSFCRSVSEEDTTTESLSCISELTENIRRDLLC